MSTSSTGAQGTGISGSPRLSTDGRFLAFQTNAFNLTGDPALNFQVVLKDTATGAVDVVSRSPLGPPGNGGAFSSGWPSEDGRYVAFSSTATNLVAPDGNGNLADAFVFDRQLNAIERVSISSAGVQGNERTFVADMTPDGRFVVMETLASNLVPNDLNQTWDVILRDRVSNTTERISVTAANSEPNGSSRGARISADGRYVAFGSSATNIVPNISNGFTNIYIRDRLAGTVTRIGMGLAGAQPGGNSDVFGISASGSRVLIRSNAFNLVPNDWNGKSDFFLLDLGQGTTTRVSLGDLGQEGDGDVLQGDLSRDGTIAGFSSLANNLTAGDANPGSDLFIHEIASGRTLLVTRNSLGVQGAIPCLPPPSPLNPLCGGQHLSMGLSADGRFVAFEHAGGVLIPSGVDVNGSMRDIFMNDWSHHARVLASGSPGQTVLIEFQAVLDPFASYAGAVSLGALPGIPLMDRTVPLAPDLLFLLSLTGQLPGAAGFAGLLDGAGRAVASVSLPADPGLAGLTAYAAFATLSPGPSVALQAISNAAAVTILP